MKILWLKVITSLSGSLGGLSSILLSALAIFCLSGPVYALTVLTPENGTVIRARNPLTHLVLKQAGTSADVRVRVAGTEEEMEPVVVMDDGESSYLHFRLPLEPDENLFEILPSGDRLQVNFQKIKAQLTPRVIGKQTYLFHRGSQLPSDCRTCHGFLETQKTELLGLSQQTACGECHQNIINKGAWQHSTTVNRQCLSCHATADNQGVGFPRVNTNELCLGCHTSKDAWHNSKVTHEVIDLGGCTLCHDPHGGQYRNQLWAEGSLDLCISCHSDKRNLVSDDPEEQVPFVHGAVIGSGCVACHDPHASNHEFMLHKGTNRLCLGCHPRTAKFRPGHPTPGHPVAGPRELRRPDRQLTCASCHNPHGSEQQYMLFETMWGTRICRACHAK